MLLFRIPDKQILSDLITDNLHEEAKQAVLTEEEKDVVKASIYLALIATELKDSDQDQYLWDLDNISNIVIDTLKNFDIDKVCNQELKECLTNLMEFLNAFLENEQDQNMLKQIKRKNDISSSYRKALTKYLKTLDCVESVSSELINVSCW